MKYLLLYHSKRTQTFNRMRIFFILLLVIPVLASGADPKRIIVPVYEITVDLVNVENDRVKVVINTPAVMAEEVEYVMPAVIPGSYKTKDFGRFIYNFKAYNIKGRKMKVIQKSTNVFLIKKANTLDRIEYWVDDTWDAAEDKFVFQPGGTNIQHKRNFVINHQGFYGYLEGHKNNPYYVNYIRPADFYGETHLHIQRNTYANFKKAPKAGTAIDQVTASGYVQLVDNPVMYCKPDTTSFYSGNMQVHISVYSDNGVVKSSAVKKAVEPLAVALKNFFGELPVDNYHFIMYFAKNNKEGVTRYGGFGALEHSYGSMYFLPEDGDENSLTDMIQSIAGHEFLHILTPLNIHSEEIENFDFRNPKMSQHLWMYEGVTEYFAHLVRLKNKLIDEEAMVYEMNDKIKRAAGYDDVSFTDMSKNILDEKYNEMYNNVYQKGALMGFLLDIRLNELSKGQKSLRELMMSLSEYYGPDKPFKDDELFAKIVELSYPELKNYFESYVIGNTPLPYSAYFKKIGWSYYREKEVEQLSFGNVFYYGDQKTGNIYFMKTDGDRDLFNFETLDLIMEINGNKINLENSDALGLISYPENDSEVAVKINRKGTEMLLKAKPGTIRVKQEHVLEADTVFNDEQKQMRKWVLGL